MSKYFAFTIIECINCASFGIRRQRWVSPLGMCPWWKGINPYVTHFLLLAKEFMNFGPFPLNDVFPLFLLRGQYPLFRWLLFFKPP